MAKFTPTTNVISKPFRCVGCGEEYPRTSNVQKWCRPCYAEKKRRNSARWLAKNLERSRAAKRASYRADIDASRAKDKARYPQEAARKKAVAKRWYADNREHVLAKGKTQAGRLAARLRENEKRKDPHYRLHSAVSRAMRSALKVQKAGRAWETLVGYSLADLVRHLERQFASGMLWANYGSWHVDHIVPRVAFTYSTPSDPDFRACWALSNLRPLWAADNISKHASRSLLL